MRYESSRDDSIGAPNSRRSRRSSTPPATAQHLIRTAHVGLIWSVLTAVRTHLIVQTAAAWPDRSSPCRGKPQSPTLPSSHRCTPSRTRHCKRSPSARHHPASVHLFPSLVRTLRILFFLREFNLPRIIHLRIVAYREQSSKTADPTHQSAATSPPRPPRLASCSCRRLPNPKGASCTSRPDPTTRTLALWPRRQCT